MEIIVWRNDGRNQWTVNHRSLSNLDTSTIIVKWMTFAIQVRDFIVSLHFMIVLADDYSARQILKHSLL